MPIKPEILLDVQHYIAANFVPPAPGAPLLDAKIQADLCEIEAVMESVKCEEAPPIPAAMQKSVAREMTVHNAVAGLDEPFSNTLLRIIDAKGQTDVEVYKRAGIDRKLFSKIRTGRNYLPSKRTALALAVALELTLEETDDLLRRAGYALSHSQKADVIVEYFIIKQNYDLFAINQVLYHYDQPLLGA